MIVGRHFVVGVTTSNPRLDLTRPRSCVEGSDRAREEDRLDRKMSLGVDGQLVVGSRDEAIGVP